jgi:uncharacterized protein (DUF58 family)
VTVPGLVYLASTAFVLVATLNSGTNILYFVFGLMVGALFVSFLFAGVSLHKVQVRRSFGAHAVAGEPLEAEYEITNGKRRWPCMALRFEEVSDELAEAPQGFVLHLPAGATARVATRLVAKHRGRIPLTTVRLRCAFPFGFILKVARREFRQEVIIYPRIGMLNRHLALQYRESVESGTMTSNVRGGAEEFYGLREYRPGDNIRSIHWRTTARTQQFMIREMAANAPPQLIVVLNLRSAAGPEPTPAQREATERAIELAASLICYGFFENFAVGLSIAGVDEALSPSPQMGRDARAWMLERLAVLDLRQIRPAGGIATPNRLAGRAQWIVVTLNRDDPFEDLLMASGSGGISRGGATRQIILALDDPEAAKWLHFLDAEDTLRLLREREA